MVPLTSMSLQNLSPVTDAHIDALKARLSSSETQWVERKESFDERKVRKTLVAFANSVRDGESAVLFIGAADKSGLHPGVKDADEIQGKVRELARDTCYPPIDYRPVVFTAPVNGSTITIVAVEIPASRKRPHFAGAAFVRRGSSSDPATEAQYHDLIASRNDIVWKLQQIPRDVIVRVVSPRGLAYEFRGAFDRPTLGEALKIDIYDTGGASIRVPIADVKVLSTDGIKPLLQIPPQGTEAAHIMNMLNYWRAFQHSPKLFIDPKNEILKQLVPYALEVCQLMATEGWADYPRERPVFDFFDRHARRFI
jgi:hypothetical protein